MKCRCLLWYLIPLLLGILACKPPVGDELSRPTGRVSGTVMYRPGYNAIPPGDGYVPPTRPQAGIAVYLLRLPDNSPPLIGRDNILVEQTTDSLGQYHISYQPGEYYLAVYEPSTGMILSGTAGGVKMADFEVSEMVPVTIKPNEELVQDFELHGLVTM